MAVPDFGPGTSIQAITISTLNGDGFQEIEESQPEAPADPVEDQPQVFDSEALQVIDN